IAAAGKRPEDIRPMGRFEEWHRGGWDPEARLADQDRDGVGAEVLYPTVGLVLCRHPDLDYKQACMDAYNRWLAEYCSAHPDRLLGVGQTAVRTPADGIEDLRGIKALGLRGVLLPSRPGEADWDSPIYDELFEAAIALRLPVSFHILTDPQDAFPKRGPVMNFAVGIIRSHQDLLAMLVPGAARPARDPPERGGARPRPARQRGGALRRRGCLRARPGVEAVDGEGGDRVGQALHLEGRHGVQGEARVERVPHRRGDQDVDGVRPGQLLDARGQVHGAADDAVLDQLGAADHARDHRAAVDADAHGEGR